MLGGEEKGNLYAYFGKGGRKGSGANPWQKEAQASFTCKKKEREEKPQEGGEGEDVEQPGGYSNEETLVNIASCKGEGGLLRGGLSVSEKSKKAGPLGGNPQ